MGDYYTQNPDRLENQPKRTICEYAESQGILVPTRFGSWQEAKASGVPIIARSEHEKDYDLWSGILESVLLGSKKYKGLTSEEELKQLLFADSVSAQVLAFYRGKSLDEFKDQFSFSYWQYIDGPKSAVIADSAIEGKYHVMIQGQYNIVEDGEVTVLNFITKDSARHALRLTKLYERVRLLDRFDSKHCPMMEFVTKDQIDYFLQYHRTRDFEPATYTLDREPLEDEIEAFFVEA